MKIVKTNNHELISNAFTSINEFALNLYVDMKHKHNVYDIITGSIISITVYEDDTYVKFDTVMFIPETNIEKQKYRNLGFEVLAGNQIWVMMPDDNIYKSSKTSLDVKNVSNDEFNTIKNQFLINSNHYYSE